MDWNEFDVDEESKGKFVDLETGVFEMAVLEAEMRKTKKGDGEYLNVKFQVVGEDCKGAIHFEMFNLRNPSEKAVQIGRAELASLCKAIGISNPKDETDLLDGVCMVTLKMNKKGEIRAAQYTACDGMAEKPENKPVQAKKSAKRPWEK